MTIGTNFYDIYQQFLCSLSFFEDFVSVNFTFIKVFITVSKEKMKKKIIIGAILGFLLLIVIGVLVAGLFLGNIVKVGMEKVGPKVTQTSLKVDSVSVGIFSGSAGVNGLVLGNPEAVSYTHLTLPTIYSV